MREQENVTGQSFTGRTHIRTHKVTNQDPVTWRPIRRPTADLRDANLTGAYLPEMDLTIKNLPGAHLKGVIYGNTTMPNGRTADDADGAVYAFYQYYAEEAEYAEEADEADA